MKFTVTQRFHHPAARCAEAFTDPALYPTFADLPKVGVPEVLSQDTDGATVRMRVRYRFDGELNGAARLAVDRAKLTWVDESVHDLDRQFVTFTLHPDHHASQFRGRGTYRFVDTPDGCERIGNIEINISFPLVGRAVEGAIASGLREHLADEQGVVERFLDGR
ncbi:DUF2505 family protein [Actinospongicola halichondriae]|uniref:DUF2505 family protein n=1 Tax=Actinospongicola halichondriae TaxID=3236844 RepID=UPI003D51FC5E